MPNEDAPEAEKPHGSPASERTSVNQVAAQVAEAETEWSRKEDSIHPARDDVVNKMCRRMHPPSDKKLARKRGLREKKGMPVMMFINSGVDKFRTEVCKTIDPRAHVNHLLNIAQLSFRATITARMVQIL